LILDYPIREPGSLFGSPLAHDFLGWKMDWHRHFGLLLTDFFAGSPFVVELEKDLSLKQQFLDVVIIRKRKGRFAGQLPDGLDDLADHNLITFKSHQETLDDWALKELTGHYVNYRKQVSSAAQPLLPEGAFRLYAVRSKFPRNLAQAVPWEAFRDGVYRCRRGTDVIHVVVAGQLAQREHNAMLHLFSAAVEQRAYGVGHYRQRSSDTSTLVNQLLQEYQKEGIAMPYTMQDYRRDYAKEHFKDLTPAEQQEAIKDMTPEQRLKDLTPEQALKALTPEVLKALTPQQRERLREQLTTESTSGQVKKRRRK
jgi:hypothetical protein